MMAASKKVKNGKNIHNNTFAAYKEFSLWQYIKRDRYLYLMLIPVMLFYFIFKYGPMYGIIIAFKDYRFADGILGSAWVGLKHFKLLFGSMDFFLVLKTTLLLNIYGIVFGFPIPIILAILLNEIRHDIYKKCIQSLLYVPYFISWAVLGGIIVVLLSPSTGVVNYLLHTFLGIKPIFFMGNENWWVVVFIISGIWHNAGWGTIIYLAAISGIDVEMYESAMIDGAGKFRRIWSITLPSIRPTIAIMLILRVSQMMDVGFEQIYALQNDAVRLATDVISTYVYRVGLQNSQYSYTAALGLFQSLVGLILVVSANKATKSLGENGLW